MRNIQINVYDMQRNLFLFENAPTMELLSIVILRLNVDQIFKYYECLGV